MHTHPCTNTHTDTHTHPHPHTHTHTHTQRYVSLGIKDAPLPAEGEWLVPQVTKMDGEAIVNLGGQYSVPQWASPQSQRHMYIEVL